MSRLSLGAKLALLFTAFAAVFLLVFGAGVYYRAAAPLPSTSSRGGGVEEPSSQSREEPPAQPNRITVLACGIDDTQQLTDVIMLACLDFDNSTARVLQIPRDTFVGWDWPTGKINAIYGHSGTPEQGIKALELEVEALTGITVDYYAAITLNGLRNVVDYMGGVPVDIPQLIEYLPGKTLWPGRQVLDGEKAEWFVRYRAGYATGDIGRINAQQIFLEAFLQLIRDKGRMETLRAVSHNYQNIITDVPMLKAVSLAGEAFEIPNDNISFHIAPGEGVMAGKYAVYALNRDKLLELLNEHFRQEGAPLEPGDLDIPEVVEPENRNE